ncbi:hypothetical protein L6R50_06680 [Myxococcota bacterium]|nr:hypothetical protein [Myxococcota bacterium]
MTQPPGKETPPPPPLRPEPGALATDGLAVAQIAFAALLHARYCGFDPRPPPDDGHYYDPVMHLVRAWAGIEEAEGPRAPDTPYALLLAALFRVLGPSQALLEWVDGGWLVAMLFGVWMLARAGGGRVSGAVAVVLAASLPLTTMLARRHNIHHPEAAALVAAAGLWAWDPRISRRSTAWGLGGLLFLGQTFRGTGLPLGLPLGALALATGARRGWHGRLLPVALGISAALAWQAPGMVGYVTAKVRYAPAYREGLESAGYSVWADLGPLVTPALALGVPAGLLALGRRRTPRWVVGLCLGWVALGAIALSRFHVGLDNFPLLGLALAVLAGLGAGRARREGWVLGAAAGLGLLAQAPQLVAERWLCRVPVVGCSPQLLGHDSRVNWAGTGVDDVLPAVRSVCSSAARQPGERCVILSDYGLFNGRSWEDDGSWGLFLAGVDDVKVVTVPLYWSGDPPTQPGPSIHGYVRVRCERGMATPGVRFQVQQAKMEQIVANLGLQPDRRLALRNGCVQDWYAWPDVPMGAGPWR